MSGQEDWVCIARRVCRGFGGGTITERIGNWVTRILGYYDLIYWGEAVPTSITKRELNRQ
jgi:hypothetical protein